ncbi:MAG TPA: FtsX-like permease family protein [Longimicrobium sp.]
MLRSIATDALQGVKSLRRARRHAAGTVLTLALGTAAALPLVAAARAGLAWTPPAAAPEFGRAPGGGAGGWTEAFRDVASLRLDGERAMMTVLLVSGLLLVAVACVNAGSLVLTRASARRHERAVRAALGAGPGRLLAHALAEGLALATVGSGIGTALGMMVLRAMQASWPAAEALFAGAPDALAVAIAVGMPAAVVVLCTALPARRAGRGDVHAHLTVGSRATPGRYDAWVRRVLAVAQFTGSMGLLVGAGLLVRGSMPHRGAAGPGFDPRDTLTLRLETPRAMAADPAARARAFEAALGSVRALPGVRAAAAGSPDAWLGLGPWDAITTYCRRCIMGGLFAPMINGEVRNLAVSAGWASTLGIPVRGRELQPWDAGRRVVMINQSLAGRLYPADDPLGQTLSLQRRGPKYTVVGVVGDVAPTGPGTPNERVPALYLPADLHPPTSVGIAVRAARGDPLALAPSVEAALRHAVPGAAIGEVMTMEARLARYAAPLRWFAAVLATVAIAALLLCSGGVYTVVAYGVARRTREIGVRMALGARVGQVVRHVLGGGLRMARTGTILGALMAVGVGQTLALQFRGVAMDDAATWLLVPTLLAAVTVVASWIPARRAARVDPVEALREE